MVAEDFLTFSQGFGLWMMSPPKNLLRKLAAVSESPTHRSDRLPSAILLDYDIDGKIARQRTAKKLLGHTTTISQGDSGLLRDAVALNFAPVLVRLGRYQPGRTEELMRRLQDQGVVGFLLSMVEHESEIDRARVALDSGIPIGAMIETAAALTRIDKLRASGLDFAFVGLVDLALQRGTTSIFAPLIDGTIADLAESLDGLPFGFGAATVVGGGAPIPNRLLLGNMLSRKASYTLLRSAFYRDVAGLDAAESLGEIRQAVDRLAARNNFEKQEDFEQLRKLLQKVNGSPAEAWDLGE